MIGEIHSAVRLSVGRGASARPGAVFESTRLHRHLAYAPRDVALWPNPTGGETIDLLGVLRGGVSRSRCDELVERFHLEPTGRGHLLQGKPAESHSCGGLVRSCLLDMPTAPGIGPDDANNHKTLQRLELTHLTHCGGLWGPTHPSRREP